ncbi:MAG: ABC transporter permease [Hyphomicrobiales bacterium]
MHDLAQAFLLAFGMIAAGDPVLGEIVMRSLYVSLTAVAVATAVGVPLGAFLAVAHFPGRRALVVAMSALMGLPPVVVGLGVYLLLSRSGPLGVLGLLYTPTAMIIAQAILVTPLIASLARQAVEDLEADYRPYLQSLGMGPFERTATIVYDARANLATAVLAGFGRAIAEVGAVILVGGNIDHVTRVMTTAIALETSKGELALALALGLILIALSLVVNALVYALKPQQAGGVRA